MRRTERRLLEEYERTIDSCLRILNRDTKGPVLQIAELPDVVRGYDMVKLRSGEEYDQRREVLLGEVGISSNPATAAVS